MYSFADFEKMGVDKPAEPTPPKAQDAACIMYTSGTTGELIACICLFCWHQAVLKICPHSIFRILVETSTRPKPSETVHYSSTHLAGPAEPVQHAF